MALPLLTTLPMVDTEHQQRPKVPLTGQVRYWEWNEPRVAEGVEISDQGVFLRTSHVLAEGAHLTLRLELPALPGMTVLGRVVRTVRGGKLTASGMGIRFLDLTPAQHQCIVSFVAQRA